MKKEWFLIGGLVAFALAALTLASVIWYPYSQWSTFLFTARPEFESVIRAKCQEIKAGSSGHITVRRLKQAGDPPAFRIDVIAPTLDAILADDHRIHAALTENTGFNIRFISSKMAKPSFGRECSA